MKKKDIEEFTVKELVEILNDLGSNPNHNQKKITKLYDETVKQLIAQAKNPFQGKIDIIIQSKALDIFVKNKFGDDSVARAEWAGTLGGEKLQIESANMRKKFGELQKNINLAIAFEKETIERLNESKGSKSSITKSEKRLNELETSKQALLGFPSTINTAASEDKVQDQWESKYQRINEASSNVSPSVKNGSADVGTIMDRANKPREVGLGDSIKNKPASQNIIIKAITDFFNKILNFFTKIKEDNYKKNEVKELPREKNMVEENQNPVKEEAKQEATRKNSNTVPAEKSFEAVWKKQSATTRHDSLHSSHNKTDISAPPRSMKEKLVMLRNENTAAADIAEKPENEQSTSYKL